MNLQFIISYKNCTVIHIQHGVTGMKAPPEITMLRTYVGNRMVQGLAWNDHVTFRKSRYRYRPIYFSEQTFVNRPWPSNNRKQTFVSRPLPGNNRNLNITKFESQIQI